MLNRLPRWLPLVGGLVALMGWSEARAVDFVVAHIECPSSFQGKEWSNSPGGVGWSLTSAHDQRPYRPTRIRRGNQDVYCDYEHSTLQLRYSYTAPGNVLSCDTQRGAIEPDCNIDNVRVHIRCPGASFRTHVTVPAKIGADPPFYPRGDDPQDKRIFLYTTFPRHLTRDGQTFHCTYQTERSLEVHAPVNAPAQQSPRTAVFHYKVERRIVSCEEKSPIALDCRVVK